MTGTQCALALAQSSPSVFNFGDHAVRIIMCDDEPWFVAGDVCAALGYVNTSKAIADHLDDDERSTITNSESRNGGGKLVTINESGLYALVLRSRKPEARKFAKWVTSEVLPAIRKTGSYGTPRIDPADLLLSGQSDPVPLPLEVEQALRRRAWDLTRQAHELIDEHLRRRVAYRAMVGYPEKYIAPDQALQALNSGDLGDALAHAYIEKARRITSYFETMESMVRDSQQQLQARLTQLGMSA